MYNPFPLLQEPLLRSKLLEGKIWILRQLYIRGQREKFPRERPFLITGYRENESQLAQEHLQACSGDPYAFLYDLRDESHLQRLIKASRQLPGFPLYYAGKSGEGWTPPPQYIGQFQRYLRKQHPEWKTKPGEKKLQAGLFSQYGRLFVKFNYEEQEEKVPLEIIESF